MRAIGFSGRKRKGWNGGKRRGVKDKSGEGNWLRRVGEGVCNSKIVGGGDCLKRRSMLELENFGG